MNSSSALFPAQIIQKKRDGMALDEAEIQSFVRGTTDGSWADYQLSALLMAIYFKSLNDTETEFLTRAMIKSGVEIQHQKTSGFLVDKHSTGGVGDKVSIILAPLAAACGLHVPMMAGRGLGHTGGTIDKLESIPGFQTTLPGIQFEKMVQELGCAIVGQSQEIAPADRRLYALRDVTATVESIPLIVASILSKKAAEGTQALVMDVKVGNGAFMKTMTSSRALAKALIRNGKRVGISVRAVLSNMDQPLGYTAGNANEIIESIEILKNERILPIEWGSSLDVRELTLHLCALMIHAENPSISIAAGRKKALTKLTDGTAWKKFEAMVAAQGGSLSQFLKNYKKGTREVLALAPKSGFITGFDTRSLGNLVVEMGGGRRQVSDKVSPNVGIFFPKKIRSKVKEGEVLGRLWCNESLSPADEKKLIQGFTQSIEIKSTAPKTYRLLIDPNVK